MSLDKKQITNLMQFVRSVTEDGMTCDGCFELLPELAESQLGQLPLDKIMSDVQNHLHNCPCCAGEYKAFLEALREIEPTCRKPA